jgi:hypothetical protein
MIAKLWAFCRKPTNLALIIALGGGVAWLWGEIKPAPAPDNKSIAAPKAPATAPTDSQTAEADNGSMAVNARDNASVTIEK